jgi:hypothetical protein
MKSSMLARMRLSIYVSDLNNGMYVVAYNVNEELQVMKFIKVVCLFICKVVP